MRPTEPQAPNISRPRWRHVWLFVLAISALTTTSGTAVAANWPPTTETVSLIMEAEAQELAEASASEPARQPIPDPIGALDFVVASDPGNADALIQRGLFNLELGKRESALSDFGAAVVADPTDADARYNQGFAYELMGQLDTAERAYERVRKTDPEGEAGIAAWWGLEALRQKPLFGQAEILRRYGAPDSFMITVAATDSRSSNLTRVEIWEYHRVGKEFTFVNAELRDTVDIPRMTRQVAYPLYRPYQFESGMIFVDAANSAGFEDYGFVGYEEPGLENVDLVIANQLVLGFLGERLFYVHTIPYDIGPFLPPETVAVTLPESASTAVRSVGWTRARTLISSPAGRSRPPAQTGAGAGAR